MINKDARQDYVEPVEVAKGVYWIGFYDAQAAFHCNPYLIVDGDEAVVIDPGSVLDYPKVASKIFSIVSPRQVKHIILHHQDPDLCASVPFLEDHIGTPGPQLVTHSRASVLIRYYGVKNSFYLVDKHDYTLTLSSGRILRFIVTPFCHFPAAIMTYDASSKILL